MIIGSIGYNQNFGVDFSKKLKNIIDNDLNNIEKLDSISQIFLIDELKTIRDLHPNDLLDINENGDILFISDNKNKKVGNIQKNKFGEFHINLFILKEITDNLRNIKII